MKDKYAVLCRQFLFSLATLILALVVGGVFIAVLGSNPFRAYALLFTGAFGSVQSVSNTLANSIPLMFTGIAFALANKSGVFNLGCEGQLYIGGICGTIVALFLPIEHHFLMIFCVLVVSVVAGMLWGGIVGFFKARFETNEVIVAIMLNYISVSFTTYLITGVLQEEGSVLNQTAMIPEIAQLSKLMPRTQLTTALLIAVAAAFFSWFLMNHTVTGFKLRAVGDNAEGARACGIPCKRYIIFAMMLSGAIASLAGITEITGKYFRFREGFGSGYGFTGVAVAALANNNPFAVLVTAILFGGLDTGSLLMSRELNISGNLSVVIQSIIILIVATPKIIEYVPKMRKAG